MLRLSAVQYRQTFTSGHSCPCLVEAESLEGDRHEVVLKLRGSISAGVVGLAREALASRLASALKLHTPKPCLVEITPEFAASVTPEDVRVRFEQNIGWHFGSTFQTPGWHAIPFVADLPFRLFDSAASVLAFDALIGNDDRHVEKSNYLIRDSTIMLIDHERAFPAGGPGAPLPWESGGLDFLRKHVFFPALQQQLPDFEPITAAFAAITLEDIAGWVAALPEEWASADTSEMLEGYLVALRANFRNVLDSTKILLR